VRGEVTANTCFGTGAKLGEVVTTFFERIDQRAEEVKRRCRTAPRELAFPELPTRSPHQLLAIQQMSISPDDHFSWRVLAVWRGITSACPPRSWACIP
jgi:hypothetical protein